MFEILADPYRQMAQNNSMSQKLRAALSGNSIGDQLKYAALHGCETKWKQCGKPKVDTASLKGKIDRFGIPMDGS